MTKPICCVAGASGGHILPCLTFAKKEFLTPTTPLLFISTSATLDKKIVSQFPEIAHHLELSLQPIPYRKWWKIPFAVCSFLYAVIKSFWYFVKHRPSCVISTGGYVSIPVCGAARLLSIPIYLFELNVIPGKAARVVGTFATRFFICFKETQKYCKWPCTLTPYPIRFSEKDREQTQTDARIILGLNPLQKTLLILGGSQGSQFLNGFVQQIPLSVLSTYHIIHQTGVEQVAACTAFYKNAGLQAQVFAYRDNLAPYYQAADLVICRAGAGTLFELLFFNKKSIVIPLETHATDHQLENGRAMACSYPELFCVLRQKELIEQPHVLVETMKRLLA